jgi:NAD+ synthase
MQQTYEQIITGIKDYFRLSGMARTVLGVSGGIDSSLTLKLAVDALGPAKVTALSMPENGISIPENTAHAKKLCEALGVEIFTVPITRFLLPFNHIPWGVSPIAAQNLKARIRTVLLYHYANTTNSLVLGTSNKSELMLGYGTKYGDLAADLEVLGDLFKEEVVTMADFVGLPREIIGKKPSAELAEGQTDEADLGAGYSEIDPILKRLDLGVETLIDRGMSAALVHGIFNRIEKNRHKLNPPPVIKIKRQPPESITPNS